jgi:hypothetical protein
MKPCRLSPVRAYVYAFYPVPAITPWRWRQHGHLKHWYPTTKLHGVTTQKSSTWNITAVKVSKFAPPPPIYVRWSPGFGTPYLCVWNLAWWWMICGLKCLLILSFCAD